MNSLTVFHPLPAPTDEEIAQILERIHHRVTRLLRRCGHLPEDPGPSDPVAKQMALLAGHAMASIQEVIATGPRAGQPVRRLRTAAAVVVVDGAPAGRGSRCLPTSPCPLTPASNSSTCAATCCARLWRWSD